MAVRTYRKILLVGKDQQDGLSQLILVEHALEFLTCLNNTVTIVTVDDEDDALGVLEIMSPERTDLVLTTDVPDGELDVLVLDSLDIETCQARISIGFRGGQRQRRGPSTKVACIDAMIQA
jgi:hypothetical protein